MAKPALSAYRGKRDFTKTAEPAGDHRIAPSSRLRFVIQRHAARRLHYDLRLRMATACSVLAALEVRSLDPADKRLAVRVRKTIRWTIRRDFRKGTVSRGENMRRHGTGCGTAAIGPGRRP